MLLANLVEPDLKPKADPDYVSPETKKKRRSKRSHTPNEVGDPAEVKSLKDSLAKEKLRNKTLAD